MKRDMFYWLSEINKASLVINTKEKLLPEKYASPFAKAIKKVIDAGDDETNPDAPRPSLVITYEPHLIAEAGQEITRLHVGRSSQDMLTTARICIIRENLLDLQSALITLIKTFYTLAKDHQTMLMPTYTNGVAAQPSTFTHYALGFCSAFDRDLQRLEEFYKRLNKSPMGSTVLNGTGWPLNRDVMAAYLGFDEIAYNTFDITQLYTLELPIEVSNVCNTIAIHISNFLQDIAQQYAQPRPWIMLQEGGKNTYVSSAMPQKRNPGLIIDCREGASNVLGAGNMALFRSHNLATGMPDTRRSETSELLQLTTKTVKQLTNILNALVFDEARALEELNLDWTASQEVADMLMLKYDIPFRLGHHIASEIVSYARKHNYLPLTFPYDAVCKIYTSLVKEADLEEVPKAFPMSEEEFRSTLSPQTIINNRSVKGGPQPSEIAIMFKQEAAKVDAHQNTHNLWIKKIEKALNTLDTEFHHFL